jgi:hypothetical protein
MLKSVQLSRPAAVLLALSALLCSWLAASSVPLAFTLGLGVLAFYGGIGTLYALAALRIWRRDKTGVWLVLVVLLVWASVAVREGHLPPPEVALAFLSGPILALAAWRELIVAPANPSPLARAGWAVIGVLVAVTVAAAPLWHCHEGFGGRSDYHCHAVIVREHEH